MRLPIHGALAKGTFTDAFTDAFFGAWHFRWCGGRLGQFTFFV